jgi:hypothetical protein
MFYLLFSIRVSVGGTSIFLKYREGNEARLSIDQNKEKGRGTEAGSWSGVALRSR